MSAFVHVNPPKQILSPHFTDEEADALEEGKWLIRGHSWLVGEPGSAPEPHSTSMLLLLDS